MDDYFLRQISLWGEETQNSLQNSKIAIVGCGGLGTTLSLALGSTGIGKIYLIDFDTIFSHNIHRQIAYKIDDIGESKVIILSKLLEKRYDKAEYIPCHAKFSEFAKFTYDLDIIVDATDNIESRLEIEMYAKKIKKPWIYASVEEWHGQVAIFKNSLFSNHIIVKSRKPRGVVPPIVSFIASFEANIVLRYLAGYKVPFDILNYIFFDECGNMVHEKIEM